MNEEAHAFIKRIEAVDTGNYKLRWSKIQWIAQAGDSALDLIELAYNYGFLRGLNAGKAQSKHRKSHEGGNHNEA